MKVDQEKMNVTPSPGELAEISAIVTAVDAKTVVLSVGLSEVALTVEEFNEAVSSLRSAPKSETGASNMVDHRAVIGGRRVIVGQLVPEERRTDHDYCFVYDIEAMQVVVVSRFQLLYGEDLGAVFAVPQPQADQVTAE